MPQLDTPMQRRSIDEISPEQCEELIDGIRARRLKSVREHAEMLALKAKQRDERLIEQIIHEDEMFTRQLERTDAAIEKLEKRALRIRALKLELDG